MSSWAWLGKSDNAGRRVGMLFMDCCRSGHDHQAGLYRLSVNFLYRKDDE